MGKPRASDALAAYEAAQIAQAAYFTAVRFIGQGRYDRKEAPTLAAAKAHGTGDGRTMIYAVTPEGRAVHVRNV